MAIVSDAVSVSDTVRANAAALVTVSVAVRVSSRVLENTPKN